MSMPNLTKVEYYAIEILKGIAANLGDDTDGEEVRRAVKLARKLDKRLKKIGAISTEETLELEKEE